MDESYLADQVDGASDNPLSCDQCPSAFSSLPELESHLETHKEQRPYKCDQCGRSYRHAGSLVNHKKTHEVGLYTCLICQKEYSNPMGLKNHLRTHSEEKRFRCDECGEGFRMSRQLSSHRKASHGFYSASNGEDLASSQENPDMPVPVLVENSSLLSNLENYIAESMVPGDFSQLVPKYYQDVKPPEEDMEKPEAPIEEMEDQLADSSFAERRYKCNQCGKAYKHAGSLANHKQSHTVGVYQCAICYKEFSNLMAMKNHCRLHSRCKSSCSSKKLANHLAAEEESNPPPNATSLPEESMERHLDQQRLSDISESSTSEEETMKAQRMLGNFQDAGHGSLDTSVKTIKKESSETLSLEPLLQFSSKENLVQEKQSTKDHKYLPICKDETTEHQIEQQGSEGTDEEEAKPGENLENRPFMCQECGRTYRHAGSLINHKKTHQTGVYSCSLCSKQLYNMAALKNHLRAHFKSRAGRKLEDTFFHSTSFTHELSKGAVELYQCNICTEVLTCERDFLQHQALHPEVGMMEEACSDVQHTEEVPTSDNCWGENLQSSKGSSEDSAYSSGAGIPDAIKREVENLALQRPMQQWSQEESAEMPPESAKKDNPSPSFQKTLPYSEQSVEDDRTVSKEMDSSELEEQGLSSDNRPYKCETCGRAYRHKSSLLNHKLTHQTGTYQCSLCPKQYSNLMALRNHTRFHSRSRAGKRDNTSKHRTNLRGRQLGLGKRGQLPKKTSSIRGASFQMNLNDKLYVTPKLETDADGAEGTSGESHICGSCGKFFFSAKNFRTHRQRCNKNVAASASKEISTDSKGDIGMFISSEDRVCKTEEPTEPPGRGPETQPGRRVYDCDLCGKTYRHSGSLINHKRTHQTGDYSCSICSKQVHNLAALKNHLRIHHKGKRGRKAEVNRSEFLYPDACFSQDKKGLFGCVSCKEFFQSEEELVVHQEVHMALEGDSWEHQAEEAIEPDVEQDFKNHPGAEGDHNDPVYEDVGDHNIPDCSITSEDDLLRQQNEDCDSKDVNSAGEETEGLVYTCEECGDVFSSLESLNDHKHTHQTGIYQCSFCPKEYPNLLALRNHFQSHTQALRNNNRDILDGSENKEHAEDRLSVGHSYDCGHCGMVFSNETDFHQHQVAHENQVMHDTPPGLNTEGQVSEFPFPMHSSERELLRRIKNEMEDTEGDPSDADGGPHLSHICGFCGKTYDDLESLKVHSLSHSNEERLSADETRTHPAVDFENNSLHLSLGLKEEDSGEPPKNGEGPENRPYTCDQCGKTYRHGGSLVNHKKTHLVGNFQCFACSRQYPNLAAYRNHLRHHPKCKSQAALGNLHELPSTYAGDTGELFSYISTPRLSLSDPYASNLLYCNSEPCTEPISKENTNLEVHPSSQIHPQTNIKNTKASSRRSGTKSIRKPSKRRIGLTNRSFDDTVPGTSLNDSLNVSNANDKSIKICEFCGKFFFGPKELVKHLSGNCNGYTENTRHSLDAHQAMDGEGEQPSSITGLLQTREAGEMGFHQRPFRCEVCGRSYRHAGSLINHKQTHKTGIFRCAICQKRFFNLMAMKNHNRIHFELKRHKCLDCGKAFRLHKQLDTHQRIHRDRAAAKKPGRRNRRGTKTRRVTLAKRKGSPSPSVSNIQCDLLLNRGAGVDENNSHPDVPVQNLIKNELNPDSRPYQCEECGRSYRHAGSLVNHKKSHTMGQYCCSICDKTYPNLMAMKNHQRTHYEVKRHHCRECGKAFKWQRQLNRHQLVHVQEIAQSNSLQNPSNQPLLESQVGEEPLGQETPSIQSRKLGRSRKRSRSTGSDTSTSAKETTPVSQSPSSPLKPSCPDCGILFLSHEELESHPCRESNIGIDHWQSVLEFSQSQADGSLDPTEEHQASERPYQCNLCGRTYRHAGSLLNHKNTHKTGVYKCSICLKQFFNPMAIKNHLRTHTAEKRFQCLECGKAFRASRELICHRRVHTGERPFHCPICNRGFSSKLTLRHHQRTHKEVQFPPPPLSPSLPKEAGTKNSDEDPSVSNEDIPSQDTPNSQEERRFKCNQCERSYRHAGSLLNHKKTHSTGVYQCPACSKEFFNLLALKNHLRIHSDQNRYPCQDCDKAFRVASRLATHRKIHEQGGPFTCPLCNKCFFRRSSFKRHQLTHRTQDTDALEPQAVGNFMVEVA
ncbi:hypothetical protein FKM82_022858 [Ascaphus truei]